MDVIKHMKRERAYPSFPLHFFNSSTILPSFATQFLYTLFSSYFTLEDVTAPTWSFMLLCLKVVYIVYNSHNLPVCFHFSSLFTNPNTHLTSHIPHPPLYNALTIVPLLVVAPSHCTAPLLNIIVLSHCNTAATLHCSNHFGYVLPLVASTDPFPWL